MSRAKQTRFSRSAVEGHIRARHALAPAEVVELLVERIASRDWREAITIGRAFAFAAQAHVRHQMTDYDRLLRVPGITREEAQLIVSSEVQAVIASWATPKS